MLIRDPLIVYAPNYDMTLSDYVSNGLRLLYPTVCEYTLEFGQAGSLHVVLPLDADDDWKAVQLNYVVRAPVEFRGQPHPQLFRVYRIKKVRSGGVPSIEFDARHIFYDLNYVMLEDVRPTGLSCQAAIQWLFDHPYAPTGTDRLPLQRYTFSSDITDSATSYFEWKAMTAALIGEDNSVMNRWNGELYVNNYYFSINEAMENSKQNAFFICYGVNLTEIEETVDCTNTFSQVVATDNQGHSARSNVSLSTLGLPFEKTVHAAFSYNEEDGDTTSQFTEDFQKYADTIQEVEANYAVAFDNLPPDDPFRALESCEVGDTGIIRDDGLGIESEQRIMKTVTNLLTGERISTETGSLKRSIARRKPWSNTVTTNPTTEQKQLSRLEDDVNDIDFAVSVGTPVAAASGKLLATASGKFVTYKKE